MRTLIVSAFLLAVAAGGCGKRSYIRPLGENVSPAGPTWIIVHKDDGSDNLFLCRPPAEGKNLPRCTPAIIQRAVIHESPEVSD